MAFSFEFAMLSIYFNHSMNVFVIYIHGLNALFAPERRTRPEWPTNRPARCQSAKFFSLPPLMQVTATPSCSQPQ